jgi:hypothetical protein
VGATNSNYSTRCIYTTLFADGEFAHFIGFCAFVIVVAVHLKLSHRDVVIFRDTLLKLGRLRAPNGGYHGQLG